MPSWIDLPIELIYMIVDYFDVGDYSTGYTYSLDILHLSRVNRCMNEVLWYDSLFYERLWKRHISVNLPNVSSIRREYFRSLRRLESKRNVYKRLFLTVKEGWTRVFDALFRPVDFTKEKDDEYYHNVERETNTDDDTTDNYDRYNTRGKRINVLLQSAIEHGNYDMMENLLDSGADMVAGYDSIDIATRFGRLKIVKRLIERGARINRDIIVPTITVAAEHGYLDILNYIIELGEDVSIHGNQAFCLALHKQHIAVAKRLIELGVDINSYGDK